MLNQFKLSQQFISNILKKIKEAWKNTTPKKSKR